MIKHWVAVGMMGFGLLAGTASGVALAQKTQISRPANNLTCGGTDAACKWQDDCCPGYYCGGPSPPSCQKKGS